MPPGPWPPDGDDAGRRHRSLGPRSLTGRLTTGVVALVVVLVLATGISTYFALRSFLLNRLDQQVTSSGQQNAGFVGRCISFGCPNGGPPSPQPEWSVVLESDGSVYGYQLRGENVTQLNLSVSQRKELVSGDGAARTLNYQGHELRITAQEVRGGYTVVTGLSTDEIDRTLHRLVLLELVVGASAVIVAVVATTWGVEFSLRRLRQVTSTANTVATELSPDGAGLQRRVPPSAGDPGTEVGQLATSMNTLLGAVETQFAERLESERRMRQFLADASHELRTPLTSIRGYAELARMRRRASGADDEHAADSLDRIESEGTRMSRLIDDLLLLARSDRVAAEEQPPQRDPVELESLLDDAVEGARASYPQREITLDTPPDLAVLGDRDELLRVVRNLVTNAAVHTREDGPIAVRAERTHHEVVIRVVDSGPGLPPEQAAHVFERFWRADKARTRARGGSGLGMSIVASIVVSHGGRVRFDSTVEGGSTVTVWLPALG